MTVRPPTGSRLGRRGKKLWAALDLQMDLTGARGEVALEACRCADRLEKLDALITGDQREWARLSLGVDGATSTLVIDNALSHARMNQSTLRALLASLGVVNGELGMSSGAAPVPPAAAGGSSVADIAAARHARRASTPAS